MTEAAHTHEMTYVVFDLGGVVVRICRGWREALVQAGIDIRFDGEFPLPSEHLGRSELAMLHQTGKISSHEYFQRVSEHTGGMYSADEVRRVHEAWIIQEYKDVGQLIDELNDAEGVTTACLSNTNDWHWQLMLGEGEAAQAAGPKLPALLRIEHRMASQQMGFAKPGEAIYHAAQEQLGCAPSQIVFFDDLAPNIETALKLNWRAHRVDHAGDTSAQMRAALVKEGVLPVRV